MWEELRRKALSRIYHDKEIGYLDPDILDFLMAFYKFSENVFTQSSCSGRITIVDSEMPWDRKNSSVIFKNHLGITTEDVIDIINKGQVRRLWLIVQGPILHLYARDINTTWNILRIARTAGFKHSGILTSNSKGILVELRTGIKMVHLLRGSNDEKIEYQRIDSLVSVANEVLRRGKQKMNLLKDLLLSNVENFVELRKDSKLEAPT
ncbi:tRNA(Phe) 7-((3-amino-3-carboxypropyl)-4-demethylwyosine(37)-N(4))-methyltransferase [Saccharolobus caldissimus]|uniref:tRNA(Phe) 7-((3-amino-3-carboxypropyl)-4-demethylwyosine(37)-N(4))-methyltransferase n=1 Tax=Saccharolobus caldissimus TaxID=1702097 RepID=A0AAQ4CNF7_9CREN|nr:hypothetical protein [Saccharolobus caldissimus]BDB97338.1 hypothetical protein SACC_03550 [Saccharolobus caldissimus]